MAALLRKQLTDNDLQLQTAAAPLSSIDDRNRCNAAIES